MYSARSASPCNSTHICIHTHSELMNELQPPSGTGFQHFISLIDIYINIFCKYANTLIIAFAAT